MMRQPPPNLSSYLQAIQSHAKNPGTQASESPNSPQMHPHVMQSMIQGEMQKFKALQEKKASLQQELIMIEQNLLKIQGSLEVFQAMGYIKLN